jgi:hypothetical protein
MSCVNDVTLSEFEWLGEEGRMGWWRRFRHAEEHVRLEAVLRDYFYTFSMGASLTPKITALLTQILRNLYVHLIPWSRLSWENGLNWKELRRLFLTWLAFLGSVGVFIWLLIVVYVPGMALLGANLFALVRTYQGSLRVPSPRDFRLVALFSVVGVMLFLAYIHLNFFESEQEMA